MKTIGVISGIRMRFAGAMALVTVILMAGVAGLVRHDIAANLERQIAFRGLALAHNLAYSCVEPMQLAADEKTLDLMLFAQSYIQTGGDEESRICLLERSSLPSLVLECLKRFGRRRQAEGIQNEGLISATVVNREGKIEAFAEVLTPPKDWIEKIGTGYVPPSGTGSLAPDQDHSTWKSPEYGGILVFGAPISPGGAGGTKGVSGHLGSIYLAMSLGLVDRAVAQAIASLVIVTVGVLALGGVLAMLIAGIFTEPIRKLRGGVQEIAQGNFNQRIEVGARTDEIGHLTTAFNDMAKGLAEREIMRGAFNAYVSKDLLQEILRNPDVMKPGGTRKVATVLFSYFSIHNEIPALADEIAPEAIVTVINDYLEVQAKIISEHGGYLDKFIGDAVVAVWGVPISHPDHAQAALKCALAVQEAVRELNASRAAKGLLVTELSIGINSGSLVVGSIGSEGRKLDYTVIGEDVNFAARLAGAGARLHGASIWAGESTIGLAGPTVAFRDLGLVEFKGLGPRRVAEITGVNAVAAASDRIRRI